MKILLLFFIILAFSAAIFLLLNGKKEINIARKQTSLNTFYIPPSANPRSKPGDIIRFEPMNVKATGAKAYRILYSSEYGNNSPSVSSGMIFIPETQAPPQGRNIVAWAHGTTGMGPSCAPSRASNPLANMTWLLDMIDRGWVVVATDYSGLGTPGTERFLIGEDEARDVLNSVRAARNFAGSQTSNNFALWGHSQGGHSVLFSANLTKSYAPELNLIAASAGAPAAELLPLLNQQYNTAVAWAIGPEISVSWSLIYKDIVLNNVLSDLALNDYKNLAEDCVLDEVAEDLTLSFLGKDFFKVNPVKFISWYNAAKSQTPGPVKNIPLLIVQGLNDSVVLPSTTSLYAKKSCEAGSNLSLLWLDGVNHNNTALVSGPEVASWLDERFQGIPATDTCNQPLQVAPAIIPTKP